MKTPFILLNRNAYIILLLLSLGVGNVWANYVYFYPVASGSDNWYADDAAFTVYTTANICDYVEVNGSGTGVWRFNIGEHSGTTYFKRRHKDACDGNWNQVSGTVDASHNVMKATGFSNTEMQSSYVINYIHGTNHVYFDNSISNFTDNIYLVIGHDYAPNGTDNKYSAVYQLERITNTNLYHAEVTSTWEDANFYAIIASTDTESALNTSHDWGSSSLSTKGTSGYTAAFKTVYNMEGGSFLITTDAAGNNQTMSINYYTDHNSLPKFDASQAAKKRDTGTDYSDVVGSWPATLNLQGTYMSGSSGAARNTITSTASTDEAVNRTYGAIQSGAITQSYTSLDANYYFEGWGSGSTPTNTEATNEYHISSATTIYAFFSKLYTLTYAPKGDYSTSTVSVYSVDDYSGVTASGSSIPTGHMITLVATPATGYEVEGWYSDASCETAYTNGSGGVTIEDGNNTFKLASLNTNSAVYPKFRPKTYTINLVNMEATSAGTTSVNVTYNASTNMTSAISKPSKTNYTFDGYWVRNESTLALETQLIDANGNWIKDVTGYTGNDGADHPTWVHDYAISLYAKWTETPRTITLNVSPAGAGTLSPAGPVTAYIVTPSATITATPNAGWKFLRWDYGENVGPYAGTGTNNTVQVTASVDGTLTAVFEPRYCLVGSLQDDSGNGGLPGWSDYTVDFTVNSSSPVDLTRTCTLQADKTYKVQVHDKATGSNLGRDGGESVCVLAEDASLLMENANNDVYLYTGGAGEYIFKITAIDGSGHPTLTVLRPHQVNFGQKYQDIDGTLHEGIIGGSVAVAKTAGGALPPGDWVTYNTSVTHTATAASPGYTFTGWWGSDAFAGNSYSTTNPMTFAVTATDNAYAKFTETPTTVTLANDGNGHVEIGGVTAPTTTVGVTTTRELTAVPNEGYMFSSWTETAKTDYSTTSTSTNPTTLRGGGSGAASQTLTANFTHRWALSAQSDGWGSAEFIIGNISVVGGKTIGYVDISLAANTNYQFKMVDKLTGDSCYNGSDHVYYMTYGNSTNWSFATDKTYNCGITTAGRGTYRFSWNVTDKTMTVTYQPSYQVNFGASVGGSVTSVVDDDGNSVPNGGYVRSGGRVTFTAAANTYYTFVGWCNNDTYGDTFNTELSWTNSNVTETQNSFAKFKSTNFVIYRTGDKADDTRAALDDVESYAGGTISEAIEFRMKVHELDTWYSLCLPFTVSAVRVWDDEYEAYYDLEPYYRTAVGATLNGGHYIIRTPATTPGLTIANFGDWRDPESAEEYLPAKNTPYIIQWHSSYFFGKYISFFGDTGQNIPASMTVGTAPSSDDVVNIYGNNAMVSGSVAGAYMLEPDYGPGAWLRLEDASAPRTVLPFECYIRASSTVTGKYRVIRRDMHAEDTATGWDDVVNSETRTTITVYTIGGVLVAQFNNCSISEAALRLSNLQHENIYIVHTDNECVKLINGLPANQYSEEPIMGGK